MLFPKRIALLVALAALLAAVAAGAVEASHLGSRSPAAQVAHQDASGRVLVKVAHQATFGPILVTGQDRALYYFTPEVGGKILCTGQCTVQWPPLLVPAAATVPGTIAGASGTFGVIVRPDRTRQVTYQGRPLYTYVDDLKPLQVLCDGVNGWFVYRVR
jgi:predicted lipoprotein with Yx(FWY)xxD motif